MTAHATSLPPGRVPSVSPRNSARTPRFRSLPLTTIPRGFTIFSVGPPCRHFAGGFHHYVRPRDDDRPVHRSRTSSRTSARRGRDELLRMRRGLLRFVLRL